MVRTIQKAAGQYLDAMADSSTPLYTLLFVCPRYPFRETGVGIVQCWSLVFKGGATTIIDHGV